MNRATYRNGDDITLTATGCDGCSPSVINGVFCHETDCPEAWRDRQVACFECGCDFYPAERGQRTCGCDAEDDGGDLPGDFMEPEIYRGGFSKIETLDGGTVIVPDDVCGSWRRGEDDWLDFLAPYVEGRIDPDQDEPEWAEGWLYRLQAPGFQDCTPWGVADCRHAAERELQEQYGAKVD